ncbi:MAG: hypothetical protein HYT07_03550 [Candidatus Levybacteria bacterium]|nr:hypothetical protein [Candidatus Levybacteria bacterium]
MPQFQWDEFLKINCVENGVATLSCIPAVFLNIINALLMFVGITSLVFIIFSGYKYMHSAGDPKVLESARNTLIFAIVGLLLVLFSFFIRNLIFEVTQVPCIKTFGFGC